jgi:membrane protease YdiL (CAAX protease family)
MFSTVPHNEPKGNTKIETPGRTRWIFPALGIVAALGTNTIANAGVLPSVGALFLLPLLVIFWYVERFSRREVGFVLGRPRHYGLGLLHPVLVLSLIAFVAWISGAANIQNPDWSKVALEFVLAALVTILATIVTEDGFFRGWLWASLRRAGLTEHRVILLTGIAFGVWHLPYALLATGYDPLSAEVPLLIINASIIGIAWGLLRLNSGSVLVPAVTHGIWNGAVYVLFNYGDEIGAFGIQHTSIFGPEAGVLGLVLNLIYTLGLWLWYRRAESLQAVSSSIRQSPNKSI